MQRTPLYLLFVLILLSSLASLPLSAQNPRRFGTINCQPTLDEIPRDPLGLTSQLGTLQLSCTNDGRVPDGETVEFRSHVVVDLLISVNAPVTNRIDFGAGDDVTDIVLAFGGDDDTARALASMGSSVDPRFPRPQYGRLVAQHGQLTETGKRLGIDRKNHTAETDSLLVFENVPVPIPLAPNGTYPGCHSFSHSDMEGCMPPVIDIELRNVKADGSILHLDRDEPFSLESEWNSNRFGDPQTVTARLPPCRPSPAVFPRECSGPPPATGVRECGTFWFFNPDDQANLDLCVKVLDGTTINDRFWVFAAATTDVEYTLTVTNTGPGATGRFPRPVFNYDPLGIGGELDLTGRPVEAPSGPFLFEIPDGTNRDDLNFDFALRAPTKEDLLTTAFTLNPAPTIDLSLPSADAPMPRYLDIRELDLSPSDLADQLGGCPSIDLSTGAPSCGASIRSVTDISFIEGELVRNGFFSVFTSGGPPQSFAAPSLPLGQNAPVRIKITQGPITVEAIDVFWNGTQYNGIVPKDAPLGDVEIRLCVGDQESAPFASTIVARNPRLFTLDGNSSGMGVFQKFNADRIPTVPIFTDGFESGDISAWGSGLGTSPARSDRDASAVENYADGAQIDMRLGGVPFERALYAGPNPGFPALDQYNGVPAPNSPSGCVVPFEVSFDGEPPSNFASMPVSPNGGPCEDPLNPYLEDGGAWPRGILDFQLLQARVTVPAPDGSRSRIFVEQARAEAGLYGILNLNLGVHYPSLGTCAASNGPGTQQSDVLRRSPPVALETGEFRIVHGTDTFMLENTRPGVDSWRWQSLDRSDFMLVSGDQYTLRHTGGAGVPAFDQPFTIDRPLPRNPESPLWTNQDDFGRETEPGIDLNIEWNSIGLDPNTTAITISGVSVGDGNVGGFICTLDPTLGTHTVPGRMTANIPVTRDQGRAIPLGAIAVGTIGTEERRIPIERPSERGMRAYIDVQERDVLSTVFDTCAFATCP